MRLQLPEIPTDTPVVTVLFDATRKGPQAQEELDARWRTIASNLQAQGAGDDLLAVLSEAVEEGTNAPGSHGRLLVATSEGVHIDRLVSRPPVRDWAVLGTGPDVLALAWQADDAVRALLVEVDRTGADLSVLDTTLSADRLRERTVTADQDELTKNREGGLHHRRIQARAEDSWERNAEQVAEEVDAEAGKQEPELVLLTGDVRMVALVRESVNEQTAALLHVLESGGRAEGVHQEAFEEEVHRVFDQVRLRRREDVIDRYRAQEGRDTAVVTGVGDVLEALQRGQVEEVLVTESTIRPESPLTTRQVWIGPEAVQVGADAAEVRTLGVDEPEEAGADVALGRLVLATDAGVTVVDDAALDVPDGVAAVLRWDDDSTPAQSGYTMSRDISEGRRRSTPA